MRFLAKHNEEIDKVVLENALENYQMIAGAIQKDIANAATSKTLDAIFKDLGESSFANKWVHMINRFLGIAHVGYTIATELKKTIDSVLSRHNLSSSIRQ